MELRAFAEQVLFATTLEEKLQRPGRITDAHPGPAVTTPSSPGRPSSLLFKPAGSAGAAFPGHHRLDQPRERGRLLHFFANHELLATELMALVLLRFPDAPAEFRRGVLRTLQEEQEHTRLYLERMAACDVHFGELPVSGYFWRVVSPMQNPIDYVAGLSLTFEQANLDFARQFSQGFAVAGDAETARLLDRIYHDEIGHVAYGLKWFRRWKDERFSDWEAYCQQLRFPLSPRRARGYALNVEGRRAAGFDPDFIAELSVCSHSRGRTPSLFHFNPFAEGCIARGRSFSPVQHQAALARDLANLPQFLGRQDDIVLIPERPAVPFLAALQRAGFPLPEFVEHKNGPDPDPAIASLQARKLGRLRPWAWGPDSVQLLKPLFARLTGEQRTPEASFNDRIARLYSKAWSAAFLRHFLGSPGVADDESRRTLPAPDQTEHGPARSSDRADPDSVAAVAPWLCTPDDTGVAVETLDDALAAIAAIRRRGHHRIIVKEAIGLAGHNAVRLWEPEILETQRRWMINALRDGGLLVVEPWLERELDFSVQFEMSTDGLKLCGYAGLLNSSNGQFRGNWAEPHHRRRPPAAVAALLRQAPDIPVRIRKLYDDLCVHLELELRQAGYLGPVGIDAFIYRTPSGECRLKPIAEINPRYTMGRLTLELMKQTCSGSHGFFRLLGLKEVRAAGCATFTDFARSLSENFPLQLEGDPIPRIRAGALCLNDPARATVCLATFTVSRQPQSFDRA